MSNAGQPDKKEADKGRIKRCVQDAKSLLRANPEGLRAGELVRRILGRYPRFALWTIRASVSVWLPRENDIERFERGWYRLVPSTRRRHAGDGGPTTSRKRDEAQYYEAFALWLCLNEDCTQYCIMGGTAKGRGKWTNPDVVALAECAPSETVKFSTEVVTAEIKAGTGWDDLITAFAQACSYKLSSHRSWVVVPDTSDKEALERLLSLCHMFGIGLAQFHAAEQPQATDFSVKVRPTKLEPDYWYANQLTNQSIKYLT